MNIIKKPCPNFWAGRKGYKPEAFVIHIMQGTLIGTDAWFNNPASQVSAHYGVGKNGEVHQYVNVEDSAWQAGVVSNPTWPGLKRDGAGKPINPNLYTIGIECEGKAGDAWTEAQMQSIVELIQSNKGTLAIGRSQIVSHNEISSYKENMSGWCDEIVKRLAPPVSPQPKVDEAIDLLNLALKKLKGEA